MCLTYQASSLVLLLGFNLSCLLSSGICLPNITSLSLLAPKNKMAAAKMQTRGFKTVVHKPMGDVTYATSVCLFSVMEYLGKNKVI